jgi:hypothetical protein
METEQLDPRAALAAIRAQRRAAADRLFTPWWSHPLLAVLLGGLVVAESFGAVTRAVAAVVLAVGAGALAGIYRSRTGLQVSACRRAGRPFALMVALVALVVAGIAVSLVLGRPAAIAAGVVVVAGSVAIGRRFDAALREELAA